MDPIAFSIGNFAVHWYGVFAAAGLLIGLKTAASRGWRHGLPPQKVFDMGPWIVGGAIIGARAFYVFTYWEEEFAGKGWAEVFWIRRGGLVFYGGFAAAALAGIFYASWKKLDLWRVADALAPSVALGHAFGRIGCLMTGCCYGKVCELPWAVRFPEGHQTHPDAVHPTQIYAASLNFLLYTVLAFLYRRKSFDGQIFALYLMAYAVVRACLEIFRGDYAGQSLLTPGQMMGAMVFAVGLGLYFVRAPFGKPKAIARPK